MAGLTTYLSILTLNVQRHCLANRIKKNDPTVCCLHGTHFTIETKTVPGWKGRRKFTELMGPESKQK
jgi:hypothetical protein